jgi:hypothetical protein
MPVCAITSFSFSSVSVRNNYLKGDIIMNEREWRHTDGMITWEGFDWNPSFPANNDHHGVSVYK